MLLVSTNKIKIIIRYILLASKNIKHSAILHN